MAFSKGQQKADPEAGLESQNTRRGSAPNNTQLLKGVLPMLILAELAKQGTHGYDLVARLQQQGLSDLSQGTVYPLLSRLEREGLVAYQLVPSPAGPARKNFEITPSGIVHLRASTEAWHALAAVVAEVVS